MKVVCSKHCEGPSSAGVVICLLPLDIVITAGTLAERPAIMTHEGLLHGKSMPELHMTEVVHGVMSGSVFMFTRIGQKTNSRCLFVISTTSAHNVS